MEPRSRPSNPYFKVGRIALVAAAVLTTSQPARADEEETVWRIFVADQEAATVTAFDLGKDARWTFELNGPSRLYRTPSGEAVVAVQSDHDAVHVLRTGVKLSRHDDHADIDVQAPAAVEGAIEGRRPFHVVAHDHYVAINFDRGGYASFHEVHDLLNSDLDGQRFKQNRAHHGFSVPMGDVVVSSVASDAPVEEGKLPPRVGIAAYNADGEMIGEVQTCTDLHGEAFSGRFLTAGCKEGVVAAEESEDGVTFTMLPYPEDFPEASTGTLWGAQGMQMFLGDYDDTSLLVIDPTTEPYFERIELPFRHVDVVLDHARPQHAYVLTEDGTLHRLNLIRGEIEASASVTEPYSMDGHWRDPEQFISLLIPRDDDDEELVRMVFESCCAEQEPGAPPPPPDDEGAEDPHRWEYLYSRAIAIVAAQCCDFVDRIRQDREAWLPYDRWVSAVSDEDVIVTFN